MCGHFLRPAAAFVPWNGTAWAADPPKPGMAPPPSAIAPADAVKRLMEGNERYVRNEMRERDNPDLLASIEYGVQFVNVPFILVLGHSNCGAVDAAIKVAKSKATLPGHLPGLVNAIKPAVAAAEKSRSGDLLGNAVAENVRRQVARLKASGPVVQKFYADKKIDIAGAVYDLATGKSALV